MAMVILKRLKKCLPGCKGMERKNAFMKKRITQEELDLRVKLNYERLQDSYYHIENIFCGDCADWPGDKEGRALLAFVSHYKITAEKISCMNQLIEKIPEATRGKYFFGEPMGETIFEQQLSGHSWYLRGLCEFYEQFKDERVLHYLAETVENIYFPTKGRFNTYPIDRVNTKKGGVSGSSAGILDGWLLSTDVGCAFMCIDGLSHYYRITKFAAVKELIDEISEVFDKIDKYQLQAQTHCSLTAGRGMMRMYEETGESGYLVKAQRIFALYVNKGMTYVYQNFNWFGKGDTWTEPCAIVDSLMLALLLYKSTGNETYRIYAARIYFNGLATLQRPNGGAGTDSTVSGTTDTLKVGPIYEAYFCCTMRLAEGLWFISENRDLLSAQITGKVNRDNLGRYIDGDIIYAEIPPELEKYAGGVKYADGHKLFPILEFYKLKDERMCRRAVQRIVFKKDIKSEVR